MSHKHVQFALQCISMFIHKMVPNRSQNQKQTRMWANAQPDGRPAEHRWRPLFNAAKFG